MSHPEALKRHLLSLKTKNGRYIISSLGISDSEAMTTLIKYINDLEKQSALNALTQLKVDRIAHTLSTPVNLWKNETEFIDQHIMEIMQ